MKEEVRRHLADFSSQKGNNDFSPEFDSSEQFAALIRNVAEGCADIPYSKNKSFFAEIESDLNATLDRILLGNVQFLEYLLPVNIGLMKHHLLPHRFNKKSGVADERFADFRQLEYVFHFVHFSYNHDQVPEGTNMEHLEALANLRSKILQINRDTLGGKMEALEYFAKEFGDKKITPLTKFFLKDAQAVIFSDGSLIELSSNLASLEVDPNNREDISRAESSLERMSLFFKEIANLRKCQEAIKTISAKSQESEKQIIVTRELCLGAAREALEVEKRKRVDAQRKNKGKKNSPTSNNPKLPLFTSEGPGETFAPAHENLFVGTSLPNPPDSLSDVSFTLVKKGGGKPKIESRVNKEGADQTSLDVSVDSTNETLSSNSPPLSSGSQSDSQSLLVKISPISSSTTPKTTPHTTNYGHLVDNYQPTMTAGEVVRHSDSPLATVNIKGAHYLMYLDVADNYHPCIITEDKVVRHLYRNLNDPQNPNSILIISGRALQKEMQ